MTPQQGRETLRTLILVATVAALSACTQQEEAAAPANDVNAVVAYEAANIAVPVAFPIMDTSWEYIDPKTKKAV